MVAEALDVLPPLKLDLGCGINKLEGFHGVDALQLKGVDTVADLTKPWPWADGAVSEVHCSHFVEHLESMERVHFWNELYRVMKPNATAKIITPSWSSGRAYGDPTHKWPPVSEWTFHYLSKKWREVNAPHVDSTNVPWGLNCDFDHVGGYGMHPALLTRSPEYQQYAINWYKEASQDIHTTLTRK
jgi:hypothetical protein